MMGSTYILELKEGHSVVRRLDGQQRMLTRNLTLPILAC